MVLLLGVSRGATAGSITFIEIDRYFSPGNTGTAMIDPETPSAADVSLNFTTPDTLLIHLGVDGAGEYLIHTNGVTGGIANNTHLPWTSLIWEVAGPPGTVPDTIGFDDPQYFVNGVINNPRCLANGEIEPGYIVLDQGTVPVGAVQHRPGIRYDPGRRDHAGLHARLTFAYPRAFEPGDAGRGSCCCSDSLAAPTARAVCAPGVEELWLAVLARRFAVHFDLSDSRYARSDAKSSTVKGSASPAGMIDTAPFAGVDVLLRQNGRRSLGVPQLDFIA